MSLESKANENGTPAKDVSPIATATADVLPIGHSGMQYTLVIVCVCSHQFVPCVL